MMGLKYQGGVSGNPLDIFAFFENSTKVRFLEDGKVGIGTTSPGQKLHVEGALRVSSGSDRKIDFLRTNW